MQKLKYRAKNMLGVSILKSGAYIHTENSRLLELYFYIPTVMSPFAVLMGILLEQ